MTNGRLDNSAKSFYYAPRPNKLKKSPGQQKPKEEQNL
jgi:hypothetical protein